MLWAEKRREDLIRSTGLTVVRWVWSDLADGSMVARLAHRLGTARHPVASRGTACDGRRTT